jgi:hypothetical protein
MDGAAAYRVPADLSMARYIMKKPLAAVEQSLSAHLFEAQPRLV